MPSFFHGQIFFDIDSVALQLPWNSARMYSDMRKNQDRGLP